MEDFKDKETGHHRGPTKAESIILDLRHCYRTPDASFEYRGWDIAWAGWRTPVDAIYTFGVWTARKVEKGQVVQTLYSTTLGVVGGTSSRGKIDVSHNAVDMPRDIYNINPAAMSGREMETLADWAAKRLIALVDNRSKSYPVSTEDTN